MIILITLVTPLDDWYYFRVGASSGAPITAVNLVDLEILSAEGEPLCTDCETIPELQIGVSDYSPDNFIVQLILHSSVFSGHLSTQMDFTFDITMSPERRRRLKEANSEIVTDKVTLHLIPNPDPLTGDETKHPTAVNPHPPSLKPVEPVKQAAEDLLGPQDGSASDNTIYLAIGGALLFIIALAGAYYYHAKKSHQIDEFKKHVQITPHDAMGGDEMEFSEIRY